MRFDIITIFPEIFDSFLDKSIIEKAQQKKLIKINIHDLRKWTANLHKTVDDRPYGGGRGMVMKVEPIFKAIEEIKKKSKIPPSLKLRRAGKSQKHAPHHPSKARIGAGSKVILFTPRGKKFNQKLAFTLSQLNQLILICGRYEGVDERVAKHVADQTISIGDYVLMGGELAAMVLMEAVSRLIPGVLGKPQLLKKRVTRERGFIEYPQYTRPEVFEPPPSPRLRRAGKKEIKWRVPKVLLSGDHKKIEEWRKKHSKIISS